MKVILFEAVASLGRPGDIVEVKPGYFRNYLAPKKLADEATDSNLKRLAAKRKILEARAASEMEEAQSRSQELSGLRLEFSLRAGEKGQLFGSVGVADIAHALSEKGYEFDRRDIVLSNPIKALGEHEIGIRLHPRVMAKVPVIVEQVEE